MKIFRNILELNWKKIMIAILIFYALVWSYLYLGVQYAEHRQNYINNVIKDCMRTDFTSEARTTCAEKVKENSIKIPFWNFLFVDVEGNNKSE